MDSLLYGLSFVLCCMLYSVLSNDSFAPRSGLNDVKFSDKNSTLDDIIKSVELSDEMLPVILWWTNRLFIHQEPKIINCGRHRCEITGKKKRKKEARTRALIFYGTDVDLEDLPFPRLPHHEWALQHEESPLNNYFLSQPMFIRLFNHTSTFRRTSDYPITTHSLPDLDYLLRKPKTIENKNSFRNKGHAPVLYIQSHCSVPSLRDVYVKELMKYIEIDSYGKCLHNKDIQDEFVDPVANLENEEFFEFISNYKFHLGFENGICDDYITEKLFRVMHVGSVPVYKGSPTALDWAPSNHSIIMVDNFQSPEKLAQYLNFLDENDDKYLKYLTYKTDGVTNASLKEHMEKREWGINEPGIPSFLEAYECHICNDISRRYKLEILHQNDASIPLMPPRIANQTHLGCPQPYPPYGDIADMDPEFKKEPYVIDWIEDYWSNFDKALAVQKMVQAGEKYSKTFNKYWDEVVRERQGH